jgi:ribosomal protein S18 acetylase RimI-like enzyme
MLESMGYRQDRRTSVQVLESLSKPIIGGEEADIRNTPLIGWLDAFSTVSPAPTEMMQYHADIVGKIPLPICTMVARHDGEPVACALGVLQYGYVGLYDVYTAPYSRKMGFATKTIQHILTWASDLGATRAYLNVMENNSPAIGLYRKLGFQHVYSYWYRIKDTESNEG